MTEKSDRELLLEIRDLLMDFAVILQRLKEHPVIGKFLRSNSRPEV